MAGAHITHICNKFIDFCRDASPRFSVQARTTILLIATLFAVTVVGGAILMTVVDRLILGDQVTVARELAASLAMAGSPLVESGNEAELRRLCNRAASEHPLLFVAFVDADGRTICGVQRANNVLGRLLEAGDRWPRGGALPASHLHRDRAAGFILADASYPLVRSLPRDTQALPDGQSLGCVRIGLDASRADQAVRHVRDGMLQLSLSALLLMAPMTFSIVRRAMRPLAQMADVARRFAEGDLSPRVCVRGADPIAQLGEAFNTMADRLSATQTAILRMNAELERRIEERTRALKDLALRDPLTNLYNRRHFSEVLASQFAAAARYHADFSLVMVDLDNFKAVNDNHGHRLGDEVLLLTARTITSQLRAADTAARFGGDEFILLLPQTSATDAETVAARIAETLRSAAARQLPGVPVDVSIGIASLRTTDAATPETLIQEVDKALYSVKRSGKGRIAHARSPSESPLAA